jgi:hypothetical protein
MKTAKRETIKSHPSSKTKECLLRHTNSVSESERPSFKDRDPAWEASTLPLSYTRQNRIYSSPKNQLCKGGEAPKGQTQCIQFHR